MKAGLLENMFDDSAELDDVMVNLDADLEMMDHDNHDLIAFLESMSTSLTDSYRTYWQDVDSQGVLNEVYSYQNTGVRQLSDEESAGSEQEDENGGEVQEGGIGFMSEELFISTPTNVQELSGEQGLRRIINRPQINMNAIYEVLLLHCYHALSISPPPPAIISYQANKKEPILLSKISSIEGMQKQYLQRDHEERERCRGFIEYYETAIDTLTSLGCEDLLDINHIYTAIPRGGIPGMQTTLLFYALQVNRNRVFVRYLLEQGADLQFCGKPRKSLPSPISAGFNQQTNNDEGFEFDLDDLEDDIDSAHNSAGALFLDIFSGQSANDTDLSLFIEQLETNRTIHGVNNHIALEQQQNGLIEIVVPAVNSNSQACLQQLTMLWEGFVLNINQCDPVTGHSPLSALLVKYQDFSLIEYVVNVTGANDEHRVYFHQRPDHSQVLGQSNEDHDSNTMSVSEFALHWCLSAPIIHFLLDRQILPSSSHIPTILMVIYELMERLLSPLYALHSMMRVKYLLGIVAKAMLTERRDDCCYVFDWSKFCATWRIYSPFNNTPIGIVSENKEIKKKIDELEKIDENQQSMLVYILQHHPILVNRGMLPYINRLSVLLQAENILHANDHIDNNIDTVDSEGHTVLLTILSRIYQRWRLIGDNESIPSSSSNSVNNPFPRPDWCPSTNSSLLGRSASGANRNNRPNSNHWFTGTHGIGRQAIPIVPLHAISILSYLLQHTKANVNCCFSDIVIDNEKDASIAGFTPLMLACLMRETSLIGMFLQANASVFVTSRNSISINSRSGNSLTTPSQSFVYNPFPYPNHYYDSTSGQSSVENVKETVNMNMTSPITIACLNDDVNTLCLLLSNLVPLIPTVNDADSSTSDSSLCIVQLLLQDALEVAIRNGSVHIVEYLLFSQSQPRIADNPVDLGRFMSLASILAPNQPQILKMIETKLEIIEACK